MLLQTNQMWKVVAVVSCLLPSSSLLTHRHGRQTHHHLLLDPVSEVAGVAVDAQVVLRGAVAPQHAVPHQPPHAVLQGDQGAAAVHLGAGQRVQMIHGEPLIDLNENRQLS